MSAPDLELAALRAFLDASALSPAEGAAALDATGAAPEDFTDRKAAAVFTLAAEWVRAGRPPDAVVFRESLRAVVPAAVLMSYFLHQDSCLNPVERLRSLRETGLRRRADGSLGVVSSLLRNPGTGLGEAVTALARTLDDLRAGQPQQSCTLETAIPAFCDRLQAIASGEQEPVIPTGIEALDAAIGGHEPGILSFIGGLPQVGKGSLLAAMHRNLARRGVRSGMVALEDTRDDLLARLVAEESGVPKHVLLKRRMNEYQNARVAEAMEQVFQWAPLIDVDERRPMDGPQVAAACRNLFRRGAKVVTVSNLTRIKRDRDGRDDLEVQDVLTELEAVAYAHRGTLWVDAHLKRRPGLDMTKEAQLDDFAFSSAIERMCKVAVLLSRPNYVDGEGRPDEVLRVLVAKQMNGKTGMSVDLWFDGPSGVVRNRPAPGAAKAVEQAYAEDER